MILVQMKLLFLFGIRFTTSMNFCRSENKRNDNGQYKVLSRISGSLFIALLVDKLCDTKDLIRKIPFNSSKSYW